MARRLPPHVAAKLAKRRGTAKQRQLAMEFQAPLGKTYLKVVRDRDSDDDAHYVKVQFSDDDPRAKQRNNGGK